MPNPANLPTFSRVEPMPIDRDASPFRDEGGFMGGGSFALRAVIAAAESAGHSLTGLQAEPGRESAVFAVFPGLGGAAVRTNPHDFTVFIHHPAMGNVYEVHTCADVEQILAVLATVSYG